MATRRNRSGWSYAEFARLPSDDGNRYEVIAGELHVTPAPRPLHQEIVTGLAVRLRSFAERHELGSVLVGPIDVLFAEGDYMAPDLVFVRRERHGIISDRGLEAAPDLIVEVLSDSTAERDRGIKRDRYAHFGVPEYWVVDPEAKAVEVYRPQGTPADPPNAPEDPKAAAGDPREGAGQRRVVTDTLTWRPVPGGPTLEIDVPDVLRGIEA